MLYIVVYQIRTKRGTGHKRMKAEIEV